MKKAVMNIPWTIVRKVKKLDEQVKTAFKV